MCVCVFQIEEQREYTQHVRLCLSDRGTEGVHAACVSVSFR